MSGHKPIVTDKHRVVPLAPLPLKTGVLHLGLGAFHRAHQLYFFDQILRDGDREWGVASVNLRRHDIVEALSSQGNTYIRWERGRDSEELRTIGALKNSFHLPSSRTAVLNLFRDPGIRMITITVSEKGYHFDPDAVDLNMDDAEITADLAAPSQPVTMPGVLAQGLEERRLTGGGPITVVSCDNYRRNGQVTKAVVQGFAHRCYPDLLDWLESCVCFPSTMVDAIVPKVRDTDREELAKRISREDPAMVIVEDYIRWVIEDNFSADRPPLESVGAEIVTDVEPYEAMKLLLVNAPHSALAYLGYMAGIEHIHEAVAQPSLYAAVDQLLRAELMPVARRANRLPAEDYGRRTLDRFANPNIAYSTFQVATDGSLKIRERLVPALSWHLGEGRVPEGLALVLAAWMRFLGSRTDSGTLFRIPDPMADAFAARLEGITEGRDIVARILGMRSIFPAHIGSHPELAERITMHFNGLSKAGTLSWLQELSQSEMGEKI